MCTFANQTDSWEKPQKYPIPIFIFPAKNGMAFTYQTGQAIADTVTTGVHGTVNMRQQVTHVICRNPDFGKGRVEDTLIEDILNLKMELLALMQMAMGVHRGGIISLRPSFLVSQVV